MKKIILGIVASLVVSGCSLTYKQPADGQPYALVKLKYNYNEVLLQTSLGSSLHVRPSEKKMGGYKTVSNLNYGSVTKNQNPEIPLQAVKIVPGASLNFKMALYFYWYTTDTVTQYINGVPNTYTTQTYHEKRCNALVDFKPENGKVYIMDYTEAKVKECSVIVYEQQPSSDGKFKMNLVAQSEAKK